MRFTGETSCDFHVIPLQLSSKIARGAQAVLHENHGNFHMRLQAGPAFGSQDKLHALLWQNYLHLRQASCNPHVNYM